MRDPNKPRNKAGQFLPTKAICHPKLCNFGHGLCVRCYQRKWYSENKEKSVDYQRKNKYGASPGLYASMLLKQKNKCAICKKVKKLFMDHNHKTKKIRRLICATCNIFLGVLESPKRLKQFTRYLELYD